MRFVTVGAVVMIVVGIFLCVVMDIVINQRRQDLVQMRFCRQMNGDVTDVEDKDNADNETAPPTRFAQRVA